MTPDGSKVYVTDLNLGTVSVIATTSNTVIATIPVGSRPVGVAITPDGAKVYVINSGSISVIATASNTVLATIPLAGGAFGNFIQPAPTFAGTPGFSNCVGQSVVALNREFGGLNAAAAGLGFASVRALQDAILAFCGESSSPAANLTPFRSG